MSNHPLAPESEADPQRKMVLNLYAAFAVSLILTLVPHAIIAIVAAVFFLGVLIAAYLIRAKAEDDSLAQNHATYIIRTIWIGSSLAVVFIGIGAAYMLPNIDYSTFQPCSNKLMSMGLEYAENATYAQVWELANPCFDLFIKDNWSILIVTGIIVILPILIYFVVRFVRGLSRAMKGYRIAKPKAWF